MFISDVEREIRKSFAFTYPSRGANIRRSAFISDVEREIRKSFAFTYPSRACRQADTTRLCFVSVRTK